ncbi:hypothetical protein BOX15_Mlig004058g1 [Macrostomum lignano]|uniref:phosphoethanolamine N-methyltransferase n=2 Tax=Macrostomum lignano TaxID=282301 RepID=A0A267E5J1_9PLAT|nr:hypothetical protein BOX15_Mlig004058g1 [Macrostomum lignano]
MQSASDMTATETRKSMASYWQDHGQATVEMMMLDENAATIAEREALEVLGMLPNIEGMSVVELGAGIGRFTQYLAPKVAHLEAYDFMQNFIDKNRELNGHHGNVEFGVADVTKLNLSQNRFDFIFSNWLFMYLDDSEVAGVFRKVLDWLRPDGYFFFRESCFHKSGSVARTDNPTRYRTPQQYNELLLEAAAGKGCKFSLLYARPSRTYISYKQNRNQMCWLVQKVPAVADEVRRQRKSERLFSEESIGKLEKIFGKSFLSNGGISSTRELCDKLGVKSGERVLDVGCGLGDTSMYLVQEYGANVIGIDISAPMISIALQRANQLSVPNVLFEVADIETYALYEESSFDVIYSRDVLQYVGAKDKVLAKYYKWLKPGGRLLISDYCVQSGESQEQTGLDSFWSRRPHRLCTVEDFASMLTQNRFATLATEDITPWCQQITMMELDVLEKNKKLFVDEFGEKRFELTKSNWRRRLAMCMNQELLWILFSAIKREE